MRRKLFILLVIFTSSTFSQTLSVTDELYGYVLGIEGNDKQKRKEFILEQLREMGVGYVVVPFTETFVTKPDSLGKRDTVVIQGENIIARVGNGYKKIVIGAHYDVYQDSPGANDNGSGVAVALALLNVFKDEVDMKHSIEVCFFDCEENGRWGSISYVKTFAIPDRHLAYINIDVVGSGNEIYIGPVGGGDDIHLMPIVREAMRTLPYRYVEKAHYPPSDHLSFAAVQLENISISVVPEGDSERLSAMLKDGATGKGTHSATPRILSIIHTPMDRSNYVSPHSMKMAFEFVKQIIILLNRRR